MAEPVTTDNHAKDQFETDSATWRSELSQDLYTIRLALDDHNPDYKTIVARLRELHMDFYADKLDNLEYHRQARDTSETDTAAATEALAAGHAEQATDQVDTTDDTGTIRPKKDKKGMASTENTKPVAKK